MQKPPAVSLIFAIILITVLLATGATMSASFLKASQRNSDLFRSTQAYYAARASIEKAIAAVAAKGVGYENSATNAISWDTTNDTVIDTTGEYKIFAQSKPLDWQSTTPSICGQNMIQCFIPMPGTGSAGENCNFEDPNQTWAMDFEDKCNWDKIGYNENITIPLYYSDPICTQDGICNPAETSMAEFALKIRTPNGETLAGGDKTIIMNWEISGDCDVDGDYVGDETCYLLPKNPEWELDSNTQLSATRINNAATINYEILMEIDEGTNDFNQDPYLIIDFLTAFFGDHYLNREILNPVLKLIVISPLIDSLYSTPIPYLEYQITTDKNISDNKIIYLADGKSEGNQGIYVQHLRATQSLGNAAVINFVVQN